MCMCIFMYMTRTNKKVLGLVLSCRRQLDFVIGLMDDAVICSNLLEGLHLWCVDISLYSL